MLLNAHTQVTVTVLSRGGNATAPFEYVPGPTARLTSLNGYSGVPPDDTMVYAARGIRTVSVDTLASAIIFRNNIPGGTYTLIAWSTTAGLLSGASHVSSALVQNAAYNIHTYPCPKNRCCAIH